MNGGHSPQARLSSLQRPGQQLVAVCACILFGWVLINTAWLCDDAYITLRTVDNLVNGFGLRWNVLERVQGFTHPLWLLVIAPFYAITREAYYTTLAIQGALSIATIFLLCRYLATTWAHGCIAAAAFVSSKALVDFSTGGLENPLAHLQVVVLAWSLRSIQGVPDANRLTGVFALATLLTLTRQDLVLLIMPALWPWLRIKHWRSMASGAAPAMVWYSFSLIYYGQLVPNTALAKLSTGISWTELVPQGLAYWAATARMDPVTPWLVGVGGVMLALWRHALARRMALGVLCYCGYIVWVGGDFMSGRFFTVPLVWILSALTGLSSPWSWWREARVPAIATAVIMALGLVAVETPPLLSGRTFGVTPLSEEKFAVYGVTDERRFYFPSMGLVHRWGQANPVPDNDWARFGVLTRERAEQSQGVQVVPASNVGLFGYWSGPRVHIVDRYGLTDPLLSRLPALPDWRIGHFSRRIPERYLESIRTGTNVITDPGVHDLYALVTLQTRGALFARERVRAVWRLQGSSWREKK